jgi:hypothetical protein
MPNLQGENLEQLAVKPAFLMYARVLGALEPEHDMGDPQGDKPTYGDYTSLMGVLNGLTGDQAEPTMTSIEAQFFDANFVDIPEGQSYIMNFTWVKWKMEELHALFGGDYTPATATERERWSPPVGTPLIFREWILGFATGRMLRLFNGQITSNLTTPGDGASGYNIQITAQANHEGKSHQWIGQTL